MLTAVSAANSTPRPMTPASREVRTSTTRPTIAPIATVTAKSNVASDVRLR